MKQGYAEKTWCKEEHFQIARFSLKELTFLNVYRSSSSSKDAFCDKLLELIDSSGAQLIFGDFNVCGQREKATKIPRFLASLGFSQLVYESTQIQGRQIDHIYVKDEMKTDVIDIERCSLYYSDRDALLLTLKI